MRQFLMAIAALGVAAAAPAGASNANPIEGRWANPKRNVVVQVERCGNAYCGTVASATADAKAKAREGGTPNLVGTRVLTGLTPAGNGVYKGKVFDPKRNVSASATIRPSGNSLMIKGCLVAGILCKEQRWTRVGS